MRFYMFISCFFIFSIFTSLACAEDSQSYEPKSEQSFPSMNALPSSPKNLQAEQDLQDLKKKPEEYRVLLLGTQIFLGRFGYGVGPFTGILDQQTKKALRDYQKYKDLTETGELDYITLRTLTDDNKTLDQVVPFLPKFEFSNKQWNQHVSAVGTWATENFPVHEALQTSEISCNKKWNLCTEATAGLSSGYTSSLLVKIHHFEIDTWDDKNILTKPSKIGLCATTTLHINRHNKNLIRLTSVKNSPKGPCSKTQSYERKFQLIDGSKIYRAIKYQKAEDTKKILRVKD